jgi:hypothetical protein
MFICQLLEISQAIETTLLCRYLLLEIVCPRSRTPLFEITFALSTISPPCHTCRCHGATFFAEWICFLNPGVHQKLVAMVGTWHELYDSMGCTYVHDEVSHIPASHEGQG